MHIVSLARQTGNKQGRRVKYSPVHAPHSPKIACANHPRNRPGTPSAWLADAHLTHAYTHAHSGSARVHYSTRATTIAGCEQAVHGNKTCCWPQATNKAYTRMDPHPERSPATRTTCTKMCASLAKRGARMPVCHGYLCGWVSAPRPMAGCAGATQRRHMHCGQLQQSATIDEAQSTWNPHQETMLYHAHQPNHRPYAHSALQ